MKCILALDQGTTSSRAIVFDEAATILGTAQQEFRQIFPQPGWVEHDATEIWATQSGVMHEALAKAGVSAENAGDLFTSDALTTVIGARFSWTLLDYGRTAANVRVHEAEYREAVLGYQDAVLRAGGEVEDAVVTFLKATETIAPQTAAVAAASRTVEISKDQYNQGAVDFSTVFLFTGVLVRRIYAQTDQVAVRHPEIEFVKAGYLGDHPLVLETFVERVRGIAAGDVNMNCLLCKYREQILGHEAAVGAPQEGHHQHVEGIGTNADHRHHDHHHPNRHGHPQQRTQ